MARWVHAAAEAMVPWTPGSRILVTSSTPPLEAKPFSVAREAGVAAGAGHVTS